jgi:hypothetical protein
MSTRTSPRRTFAKRPTRSRRTAYICLKGHTLRQSRTRGLYCEVCDK